MNFVETHKGEFGVEPMCKLLPIAPSTYYARAAVIADPSLACKRVKKDKQDFKDIQRVFEDSGNRYGIRKVWHQLLREGSAIARCTVHRLMKNNGLQGVVRGKKVITTNSDALQPCPDDKVNRQFTASAPNQLCHSVIGVRLHLWCALR